jgi:hypothetical protein
VGKEVAEITYNVFSSLRDVAVIDITPEFPVATVISCSKAEDGSEDDCIKKPHSRSLVGKLKCQAGEVGRVCGIGGVVHVGWMVEVMDNTGNRSFSNMSHVMALFVIPFLRIALT